MRKPDTGYRKRDEGGEELRVESKECPKLTTLNPQPTTIKEQTMKSKTEYLTFHTETKREYINITEKVEKTVKKSGVAEGIVMVSAMHITAGVYINDAESGLIADIDEWLQKLAPEGPDYRHHGTGEVNGDAHLKNLLIGHQVLIPVTGGRLDLGTWQQVYYAEFDGKRDKRLVIKVIGE